MKDVTNQEEYKFPKQNTYPAGMLLELLKGEVITNAKMMELLNCPHSATVVSHLRDKCNWRPFIKQCTVDKNKQQYWIDKEDRDDLWQNDPRIEMFLESNKKS